MSTEIYDFDYEKELQKNSDNFVPLGSKNPQTNIRTSPIIVPDESKPSNIRTSPIALPVAVKSAMRVSSKRAETPATTTARKAIVQKMPIIFRQNPYDYELNRPFSPIQSSNDDEGGIFFGGKKRSRSTRRKRKRSTRSKRTKKSSSRRYRGRKSRR